MSKRSIACGKQKTKKKRRWKKEISIKRQSDKENKKKSDTFKDSCHIIR
jgi:hypothetical protein